MGLSRIDLPLNMSTVVLAVFAVLVVTISHASAVAVKFTTDWEEPLYDTLAPTFNAEDFLTTVDHRIRDNCLREVDAVNFTSWVKHDDVSLPGMNYQTVKLIRTFGECLNLCRLERACFSVDFSHTLRKCLLNNETGTLSGDGGRQLVPDVAFTYYEKPSCTVAAEDGLTEQVYGHFFLGLKALMSGWNSLATYEFEAAIKASPRLGMAYWGLALSRIPFFDYDLVADGNPVISALHGLAVADVDRINGVVNGLGADFSTHERVAYFEPIRALVGTPLGSGGLTAYSQALLAARANYTDDRYLAAFSIQALIGLGRLDEARSASLAEENPGGTFGFQLSYYLTRVALNPGSPMSGEERVGVAYETALNNLRNPIGRFYAGLIFYFYVNLADAGIEGMVVVRTTAEYLRNEMKGDQMKELLPVLDPIARAYMVYMLMDDGPDKYPTLVTELKSFSDLAASPTGDAVFDGTVQSTWYGLRANVFFGFWFMPNDARARFDMLSQETGITLSSDLSELPALYRKDPYHIESEAVEVVAIAIASMSRRVPVAVQYDLAITRLGDLSAALGAIPDDSIQKVKAGSKIQLMGTLLEAAHDFYILRDTNSAIIKIDALLNATAVGNSGRPEHNLVLLSVKGHFLLTHAKRNKVPAAGGTLEQIGATFAAAVQAAPLHLPARLGLLEALVYKEQTSGENKVQAQAQIQTLVDSFTDRFNATAFISSLVAPRTVRGITLESPTALDIDFKVGSDEMKLAELFDKDALNGLYPGRSPCVYEFDSAAALAADGHWTVEADTYLNVPDNMDPLYTIITANILPCVQQCAYRPLCRSFNYMFGRCRLYSVADGDGVQTVKVKGGGGIYYKTHRDASCNRNSAAVNSVSYFKLGMQAFQVAMFDKALEMFTKSRELDPRYGPVYVAEYWATFLNKRTFSMSGDAANRLESAQDRFYDQSDELKTFITAALSNAKGVTIDYDVIAQSPEGKLIKGLATIAGKNGNATINPADYSTSLPNPSLPTLYRLGASYIKAHRRLTVADTNDSLAILDMIDYANPPTLHLLKLALTVRLGNWEDAMSQGTQAEAGFSPKLNLDVMELLHYIELQRGLFENANSRLKAVGDMQLDSYSKPYFYRMYARQYFETAGIWLVDNQYTPETIEEITPATADTTFSEVVALTALSFAAPNGRKPEYTQGIVDRVSVLPSMSTVRHVGDSMMYMAESNRRRRRLEYSTALSVESAQHSATSYSRAFNVDAYTNVIPIKPAYEYFAQQVIQAASLPTNVVAVNAVNRLYETETKFPQRSATLYWLGKYYEGMDNRERAEEYYRKLINTNWGRSPEFIVKARVQAYLDKGLSTLAPSAAQGSEAESPDYILYVIIAAAIITALIIITIVIACSLSRNRSMKKAESLYGGTGSIYSERVMPEPGSVSYKDETMPVQEEINF